MVRDEDVCRLPLKGVLLIYNPRVCITRRSMTDPTCRFCSIWISRGQSWREMEREVRPGPSRLPWGGNRGSGGDLFFVMMTCWIPRLTNRKPRWWSVLKESISTRSPKKKNKMTWRCVTLLLASSLQSLRRDSQDFRNLWTSPHFWVQSFVQTKTQPPPPQRKWLL